MALAQIRERRLYRIEFQTFEAYCQAKWHCSRQKANRLIAATKLLRLWELIIP